MTRARIAVTCGSEKYGYFNYAEAVRNTGAEPVYVYPDSDTNMIFDQCDGLLVTGGTDVDPQTYSQRDHAELGIIDAPRDRLEIMLTKRAWKLNVPTLCICRGMQLLNTVRYGTLQQHLDGDSHRPVGLALHVFHDVEYTPGSWLSALLKRPRESVNSRHHQAIRPAMVGRGLQIAAMSPDGLVEAIESPSHRYLLGVQWHPERPEMRGAHDALFHALTIAANGFLADRQRYSYPPRKSGKLVEAAKQGVLAV